jgi:GTP cyclohydrolase I
MAFSLQDTDSLKTAVRQIISAIGDNPDREGLTDTPKRVAKAYAEMFAGYSQEPEDILTTRFIDGSCQEMVILKDIEFTSFCEHHMLPFFGKIHIAYLPNKSVVGISKLARLVDCFAKRLQIQERMTTQIVEAIIAILKPHGAMAVCEAQHLCITSRGIKKAEAKMITSAVRGSFEDINTRTEFLNLIKGHHA